jgi:hypothetical protein
MMLEVDALDDGAIEDELCCLAGHIAAATARMVLLLAEFDRRGAFGKWGCSSSAHWMTWKCAMSGRAARERLRVGRALASSPRSTRSRLGPYQASRSSRRPREQPMPSTPCSKLPWPTRLAGATAATEPWS